MVKWGVYGIDLLENIFFIVKWNYKIELNGRYFRNIFIFFYILSEYLEED